MTFETSGSVQAIHRPQNVQKIHKGAFLSVPSLPKVQNGICIREGWGWKERGMETMVFAWQKEMFPRYFKHLKLKLIWQGRERM